MRVLELFAGSRSIGRAAEELGYEVCSVDINDFKGIDIVKDIEFLTVDDLPWIPSIGWGSPMCTTYSIAAISTHRDMGVPKTDFAAKSDRVIKNVLKLYKDILKLNPNFKWYLENPRGYLRKMDFMQELPITTVTYCSYGAKNMKPTDIWSNNLCTLINYNGWRPRKMCHNYKYDKWGNVINKHCHHESARRGAKTGTQGLKNNYERSKIPRELCIEILKS